jgi:hypothetical protein
MSDEHVYMIVGEYNPVHQLSRKDLEFIKSSSECFGIELDDDQALRLLDNGMYHKLRLWGAGDTELRDEFYIRFIKQVMGSFSDENHSLHYDQYHAKIVARAKEIGFYKFKEAEDES